MIKAVPSTICAISLLALSLSAYGRADITDIIYDTFDSPDTAIATKASKQVSSDPNDPTELIIFYAPDSAQGTKIIRVYKSNSSVEDGSFFYSPDNSGTTIVESSQHPTQKEVHPSPPEGRSVERKGDTRTVLIANSELNEALKKLYEKPMTQLNQQSQRLDAIETDIDRINKEVDTAIEGTAIAMAMATTPQATGGKNMVGVGAAYFEGRQSINIGVSTNFGDNNEHTIKLNFGNAGSTTAGAVGYGYSW